MPSKLVLSTKNTFVAAARRAVLRFPHRIAPDARRLDRGTSGSPIGAPARVAGPVIAGPVIAGPVIVGLRLCGALLAAWMLASAPAAAQSDSTSRPENPEQIPVLPRVPLSPFSPALPDNAYRHSVQFDTSSNTVEIYESLFGSPLGQPRIMSLDDFLAERQHEQERRMWEDRARAYQLNTAPRDAKDDLEKIIGKGTSIDIPIPQNPIFSIFGAPTISINVNGSVNVSAGWQWDNNNLTSIDARGSTQSAPFFNQNIQVAVSGKVGDKLKLNADFDTQNTLDFQNQLKIAFGGGPESDDDIIQGVEAGNVQLQTPSTLIGGSQTLFGVKSSFKFGPLFLTAIASQKRGERKTVTVNGGSVKTQVTLKPYQWAPNHFWLDTTYIPFYDQFFSRTPPAASPDMQPYNVKEIEVYEQVKEGSVPGQFKAIAYADLPQLPSNRGLYEDSFRSTAVSSISGSVQRGQFIRLDPKRYEFDRQLGTLTIKSLQPDKMYAVAYRTNVSTYGELSNTRPDSSSTNSTIAVLKLVYVSNMQPSFTTLWRRQMKNIYQLQGVRNVDLASSMIRITYGVPPDTSEALKISGSPRLVTILGVDRLNSANEARHDGVFDIRSPYFFDPSSGEIIFPSVEPFRKGLLASPELGASASQYVLNAIYDLTPTEAQRDPLVSRYTIAGDIAGTGGSKISLGAFNLAPNSIKVSANGELLREGLDYRVDPVFGEVTLISPKANSATGNLVVEYEQNDFYTVAQKTLLGLRADYDLFSTRNLTSKLGMTMMRYSQSLPTEKVQIYSGDEPVTNLMIGFDGSLEYKAKFLTKAIDALPFIDTKEPSSLSLRGEWAMTMPNPNTKESLVASDEGKGAAYIDDFESGAKRQIQLGQQYTLWHPASPPVDSSIGYSASAALADSIRASYKGLFYWYNRTPAETPTTEIWPNRNVVVGNQKTPVMDLIFDPNERGMYNSNFDYEANYSRAPGFRDSVWGGMMRSLSFYTTNLDEENIDYIEITMQVPNADDVLRNGGKMYIDLGQISEDVIPNQELNTEDGITPNNSQPDDILNEGEDVGIDSLSNAKEIERYGALDPGDPDPMRDDFSFTAYGSDTPSDYKKVNGMEGNVGQERGPFPDTEDLNGNKSLDQDNTYFRYEVNLDPDPTRNPQIVGSGNNGWRQYRIPIRTNYRTVGNPSFANVQFARVWFKSPSPVRVRMAEFNLVGSDWRNMNAVVGDTVRDPKLDIAFVNLEDNASAPDFYALPTGLRQEYDPTNQDILKNEQSLSIRVKNLERGEARGAVRIRPRAFDLFNYKRMKFFLHGGGDMDDRQIPGQPSKVVAFMRFGWDSLNYYEYRVPLLSGWHEHTINFPDLTAIKQLRSSGTNGAKQFFDVPNGEAGSQFAILGLPSLTRIQFVAFGVENTAYPGALTTTMWVDELRVVGAEDADDWAATLAFGAKLADLGNVTVNYTKSNPNFHRLEDRFGNRVESTNWSMNSVFQLEKFLPNSFKGSSVPFTYNHVEKLDKPRYVAESDVDVEGAVQQILAKPGVGDVERVRQADSLRTATQTLVVQDAFAFSNFRLAFPGQNWWVRDIFNRFTFGFNYDQTRERSPLVEERFQWNWDFKGQYSVNIPPNFDLRLFGKVLDSVPVLNFWKDFRINFLPSTFTATTGVHRERKTEQLRDLLEPSPVVRDFRATRGAQFNWRMTEGGIVNLTTDYSLDARSLLTNLETDSLGRQRGSGEITRDLFFNEGRLFNFGLDNDLAQSITFNTRPRIPFIPDIDRYVTPSARYKVTYNWQDQLSPTIGLGSYTKSAQWSSTSTLGLDVRLRQIGNILFGEGPNGRTKPDSVSEGALTSILRYLIKIPILDFETIRFQYNQNNGSKNPGVVGSTGISNLWGRSLLFRSESPDFGPGAAYQLGLTSDPHGTLDFGLKSGFPFVSVTEHQGIRAPNIYVQDNYSQKNTLTASTERGLWPGASLSLNWSVDWGYNNNYSVTTNANGFIDSISTPLLTGNVSRTYLSLPDLFFINVFHNDIEGVVDEYRRRKDELAPPVLAGNTAADSAAYSLVARAYNQRLTSLQSEVFEKQLEAFNWLPGDIGRYLPRMNWNFQWNGLEKLPLISGWAQSVSLRHAYIGKYSRNYRASDEGEVPETQTVTRGFQPLVQLTITGKPDVFKGTATGSISYNSTTDFALVAAARAEVSQELKNEMQAQFSYQRRGLNFPIFGLNLKNDIEFSLTFSYSRNNRKRFNLVDFTPDGNNDGSTRLSFRPSARYSLSNTVTASAFVSYDATIPDAEGSRDIKRSTTKVGVDIRVGISGGR